ncbi:MAG: osmotically inducible protein OsmC [Candidatus Altiarchaeales archaeon]|nr:osmotically inducible protein OsmC [Candidatus Altiarchaeales archaeon]MBD3415928.1 osmotically inducible protein OsmC [Candidatus Altiarchaeales archaeon]
MDLEVSFPGGLRVDVGYKGHNIRTDQPVASGGGDAAPAPFDLFLASIASCVGIYVLQFLRARDLPTEGLKLKMSTDYSREERRITNIAFELTLPDGFPEEYRDAVVRSAMQCAVKRHMEKPPEFDVKLV